VRLTKARKGDSINLVKRRSVLWNWLFALEGDRL